MMDRERTATAESGPGSRPGLGMDDRGISEVVAFILTFAIILGSVGLLYSTAFGAMIDYQETEQETNAVRAMDSITDHFNDVIRSNGVNERYGELSLRGGRISTADGGTAVTITITDANGNETELGTSGGDERFTGYGNGSTAELGEFAYQTDDTNIAYEGGGLVRGDESGSALLRRPQVQCTPERNAAVISLVAVSADNRSVQASGPQGFRMSVENRSSAVYTGNDVASVNISVDDTEYEDAWTRFLSASESWESTGGLEGTCDPDGEDLDRVVVTIVEVDIEY